MKLETGGISIAKSRHDESRILFNDPFGKMLEIVFGYVRLLFRVYAL